MSNRVGGRGMGSSFASLPAMPTAEEIITSLHSVATLRDLSGLLHILPHAQTREEALLFLASEWRRLGGEPREILTYLGRVLATPNPWRLNEYRQLWGRVSALVSKAIRRMRKKGDR